MSEQTGKCEAEVPNPVVSLLDRLKSPTTSNLPRKRKVLCNPPSGKKRSSGSFALKDPNVPPSARVKEFPNEELTVNSVGRLFCKACRETLSVKRSTLANHIKSAKHNKCKKKLKTKQGKEIRNIYSFKKYDESVNPKGQTLLDEQRAYRVKVMTTSLIAGVPISEENALRLHEPRHMLDLNPFILDNEKSKIKTEIKNKYLSLIFDGTSRLGEVLAVVFRYIGDDWQICQRLVRLEFLAKA